MHNRMKTGAPLVAFLLATITAESEEDLRWPVPGVRGKDWVLQHYVDHDPGPALRDYLGGTRTYDGHKGTDIAVPNFRWMDNGFPRVVCGARKGSICP